MKKKILIIALILILAMSVSALISCTLKVTSIELVKGSLATEYYVGETVDMSQAKITVTYNDGTDQKVTLTESMLNAAISTAQAGKTKYTITYEGKTCEFEVEVKLPTLSIKAGSFSTSYYVGDEVSYNGAKIVVKNGDAQGVDVDLTAAMVSPAISTTQVGKTTHTITYNGATTTFEVTVSAPEISLVEGSLQLEYLVGETVDMSGAKISVKCGAKTTEVGFDNVTLDKEITTTAAGKTTYTVSYNSATTTFEVIVRQVADITNVGLNTEYIKDEQVSLSNLKLTVKYSDDTTKEIALTWDMIYAVIDGQVAAAHATSIDTSLDENVTEKTVKYAIKYGGQSKEIEITIRDIPVQSIAISSDFVTNYYIGYNTPSFAGNHLVVTLDNEAEDVRNIALTNADFEPALPETFDVGTYTYTLTYRGKTTTLTINVYDIELQIVDGFKKAYNVGDPIFVEGKLVGSKIKVVAKDSNNTVKEDNIEVTEAMVTTLFSTDTAGNDYKTLVIEYKGKTLTIDDIVVNPITISLATGDNALKTIYSPNEQVSLNGKIVVSYIDGTSKLIDITSDMLSHAISTNVSGRFANSISYLGSSVDFDIVVKVLGRVDAFSDNSAYTNVYSVETQNAKPVTATDYAETDDGKLSSGTFVYEVGNVNKFKFEPLATGYDENGDEETFAKPFVKMQLYIKETLNGQYTLLTADEVAQYVTVTDNVYYAFATEAGDRYFKMVLTIDDEIYNEVSNDAKKAVTVEFKVVPGYNVYDQKGLSVFDNINKKNWAALKQETLECDDKPLYQYTDEISLIVMHNSFEIDPMLLPSNYFWDKDADYQKVAFNNAQTNMRTDKFEESVVNRLNGSLRDGIESEGGSEKWYTHGGNVNTACPNGEFEEDNYRVINDQKALYNTTMTNISGNGMMITIPVYSETATRNLVEFYGRDARPAKQHAVPHWALFKVFNENRSFEISNLRLDGNTQRSEATVTTAGINMINAFADNIKLTNVCATGFYTDITLDVGTDMTLNSVKLVDSYSNMFYMWRSHADITTSVLRKAGGPLILMEVGDDLTEDRTEEGFNQDFSVGCVVNVDTVSVLESYASGEENWYAMFDASAIIAGIKAFSGLTSYHLGKSLITKTTGDVEMLNVIAAMIISPGELMKTHPNGTTVAYGVFSKVDAEGNYVEQYAMHDPVVQGVQQQARTAIFSSKGQYNYAYLSQDAAHVNEIYNPSGQFLANPLAGQGLPDETWEQSWRASDGDLMCIYMHAGLGAGLIDPGAEQVMPYFGVILGL